MKTQALPPGFSLVEVVLALGLVTFVVVAMIGLFSVGLNGTRDSEQNIGAANLAAEMVNKWMASPTNRPPASSAGAFALDTPPLDVTTTTPSFATVSSPVGAGGYTTSTTNKTGAYRVNYACWRDNSTGFSDVKKKLVKIHLILTSPYDAALTNAQTRYEVQASYLP